MIRYKLSNRRYIGSKTKLRDWIFSLLEEYTSGESFCDLFAGTGVVAEKAVEKYNRVIINDFLFSNYVIYEGFFSNQEYSEEHLEDIVNHFNNNLHFSEIDNYFSINFGDKYFGENDARKIGNIREYLQQKYNLLEINWKEYCILLASLIYSMDKIANTVGHYEAYRKVKITDNRFKFNLISPIDTSANEIEIYRNDSNELMNNIEADIIFIDPPYNSRQYSRFYHVIENLVTWKKPELFGVALKPKEENMSEYCRNGAYNAFENLIHSAKCKYIAVTYNNTYTSKSTSSQNKMTLEQIKEILCKKGNTQIFEIAHTYFSTGKTHFKEHKEYLFITEVSNE